MRLRPDAQGWLVDTGASEETVPLGDPPGDPAVGSELVGVVGPVPSVARVFMSVDYKIEQRGRDVIDYSVVLVIEVDGRMETVRVYDGAHGENELHRYTREGAKQDGPSVTEMLDARARNDDETIEENLLEDLAAETLVNEHALARKDPMIAWAVAPLVLAIAIELAAGL